MMNTAASNPARAWPTGWGKEAVKWAKDKLFYAKIHGEVFADRLAFVRACVAGTNGMIDPKVPSTVWDEANAKQLQNA